MVAAFVEKEKSSEDVLLARFCGMLGTEGIVCVCVWGGGEI